MNEKEAWDFINSFRQGVFCEAPCKCDTSFLCLGVVKHEDNRLSCGAFWVADCEINKAIQEACAKFSNKESAPQEFYFLPKKEIPDPIKDKSNLQSFIMKKGRKILFSDLSF